MTDRDVPTEVWVVYAPRWGESGVTIVAICATEDAARETIAEQVMQLDYQIERWDVTR